MRRDVISEADWIEELRSSLQQRPPSGAVAIADFARRLGVSRSCAIEIAQRRGLRLCKYFTDRRWRTYVCPPTKGETRHGRK